ncbi:cellulase family glycosylhydrolase [Mycobacterium sp. 2YAF39]|uniref:cellulase family glycosylhydrolase n=1 Tax=Mycobacterium sp. 2YAF39 TaxID=3233033 RepID=UPI003F9992FF
MKRIFLWALSFIAVLGLVIAVCVSLRGKDESSEIGMMVRLVDADPATVTREFDLMEKMNVTWVRADFFWPLIEPERGAFTWTYSDAIVKEASARRMNVVAILSHTPEWARGAGTTSDYPPVHTSDFAEFARATAARYAPLGVHTWEVWNEPNSDFFWAPAPDANHYGQLFRATAAAVRAVDPNATLMTGGLTRGTDTPDGLRISQMTFVKQLYANGTAQLADAIAVHPYTFPALPSQTNVAVIGGINEVPALHQLMEQHGDGGKKVWITEFGAPTGTATTAVSDKDQADTILQARELVQQWPWAGPLIVYELRDGGSNPAVDGENFGVVRRDFSLKPAGRALVEHEDSS